MALAATGCGTGQLQIDHKKAEGLARQIAINKAPVKSVSCPSGLKAKKGADFDCDIHYASGATGTIRIHQLDDKGRIRTSVSDLN
jgi:NAD(P)H-hydrate repair Nnr-like enzyme with NAD(P)H-hydrate epimerase domain